MDDLRFTSFVTVHQSYQDDVWIIMKGCVQWNSVYGRGEEDTIFAVKHVHRYNRVTQI